MKIGDAITKGVTSVSKEWTKYRKKEYRSRALGRRAREDLMYGRIREKSIKEIAYECMEEAYLKASGGGTLPASARQIMYQARPIILAKIDKLGKNFDQYFTQQLLPGYLMEYSSETADWDVVFDAREHFWEPHTKKEIQLGTLEVRKYLRDRKNGDSNSLDNWLDQFNKDFPGDYPTKGPDNRFENVLFIEKEGFIPLLKKSQIAERYDLAIMSTKGFASTAARSLMEELSGELSNVRFLVLHDFDKSGFSIVGTLSRDTWRYEFQNPPEVIDLGLRLEDLEEEALESEPVHYRERHPSWNLRENGATQDEIDFLVTGYGKGQRVELNAFTSDNFIEWLERKLKKYGVNKVIPGEKILSNAYRRTVYEHRLKEEIDKIHEKIIGESESIEIPNNLNDEIEQILSDNSELAWDHVIAQIYEDEKQEN